VPPDVGAVATDGLGVPLVPLVRRQAEKAAPISYAKLKQLLEGVPLGPR